MSARSALVLSAAVCILLAAAGLTGCARSRVSPTPRLQEVPTPVLLPLAEDVWIHQSWAHVEPWGLVLSQGLVVRSEEGVLLVDTAWNDADTEALLALVERTVGARVDAVVVTHAHDDKMGGLRAVQQRGARTLAHRLTQEDAPGRGLQPAAETLDDDEVEVFAGVTVFYPGPAHTRDNVIVYHAPSRTLFGGCLVRPGESQSLGNTADADVAHWPRAVEAIAERFPEIEHVIPSHGAAGGRGLFEHTRKLAEGASVR